jgi:hypothetical protein
MSRRIRRVKENGNTYIRFTVERNDPFDGVDIQPFRSTTDESKQANNYE